MSNYYTTAHKYTYIWNKYRPAILKFMVDSSDGAQEYKFSKHEFHSAYANEKGGHSFTLRIHLGKSITDIRKSDIAKDLLLILQRSEKAMELSQDAIYDFTLDKQFMLHITQEAVPEELTEEESTEVEDKSAKAE